MWDVSGGQSAPSDVVKRAELSSWATCVRDLRPTERQSLGLKKFSQQNIFHCYGTKMLGKQLASLPTAETKVLYSC